MNLEKETLCQQFLLPSVIICTDGQIHNANEGFQQLFISNSSFKIPLSFATLFQGYRLIDHLLTPELIIQTLQQNSTFTLIKFDADNKIKAFLFLPLLNHHDTEILFIVLDRSDELQELASTEEECKKLSKDCQSFVKELMRSKEQVKQAIQVKKSFLANMSHEMNTPLNAILGFAQLLKVDDSSQQRFISGIIDAGQNLGTLISDILDISSYSSGKLVLKNVEVDFPRFIKDVALLWEMRCFDYDIDFELKSELNGIYSIFMDAPRCRQILSSLMSNAIKFSRKPGKVILRIHLKDNGDQETCSLVINVIDNGIGISKQQLPQMFEIFNRGCNDLTAQYSGAGIGLPIASALVELMEGKISVQSSLAKGSIFSIIIPKLTIMKRNKEMIQLNTNNQNPPPDLMNKSILIVEDEPLNRMVLAKMASKISHQVFQSANGDEAIIILSKHAIDLVVMDIDLPGMNGIELAELMKVTKAYKHIPIVACTALPVEELPKNADLYFKEILPKPVKQMILIKSLKKALNSKTNDL